MTTQHQMQHMAGPLRLTCSTRHICSPQNEVYTSNTADGRTLAAHLQHRVQVARVAQVAHAWWGAHAQLVQLHAAYVVDVHVSGDEMQHAA